jgi:tRNA(Ile2) C34 agmatinyltransferase TiaS
MATLNIKEIEDIRNAIDFKYQQFEYDNNPKYFDPFLKTLKRNTNINNHTENSVLIVVNFGEEHQKTEIKAIQQEQEKQGYIPYFCNMARYYLVKNVLNNMKNKKLARKINGCL